MRRIWERLRRVGTRAGIPGVVLLLAGSSSVWAQSAANSGQIVGRVVDPSDAVVPGAEITVRNKNTNYTRSATTDNAGRYVVPLVPLGPYEVTAKAGGFAPATQEVFVTLGSSIAANFKLAMGAISEEVQVSAEPLAIESTASSAKSILTEAQIRNLPSNGRKIEGIFLQTPTAQIEPECHGLSISGQKGIHTNVNVDGGDYDSTFGCGIRGRLESAPTFSLEALAEFHVIRNGFSAEFGRSTGGLMNMATKSGTNQYHGSALYLVRDSNLAATDAFGRESLARIQQLGGSLGGPFLKDRTFFFTAPEIQRARKPVQVLYSALDTQNVRQTPGAEALLAVAPEEEITAVSDSQAVINRIDHRLSENHSLFGRFDFSRTEANNNPGANRLLTGPNIETITNRAGSGQAILMNRSYTAMAQLTSFLSSRLVNELRFQFAREARPRSTVGTGPEVTVYNTAPVTVYPGYSTKEVVGIYGPQASGLGLGNLGFSSTDHRYQLIENFSVVSGGHTAKFGFDFTRIEAKMVFNPGANAVYDFGTLSDYLARRARQYQQFAGSGKLDMTINQAAFYVQDEWRLRPGLTLSPGFRYDAQFNPSYLPPTVPQNRVPRATYIPDDTKMVAPRLGIAWDIGNNGKTVVRAGGGLFYAPTHMTVFAQSILFNGGNPDLASRIVVNNPAALAAAFSAIGIDLVAAPLDRLPVFTLGQLHEFFGDLPTENFAIKAPG